MTLGLRLIQETKKSARKRDERSWRSRMLMIRNGSLWSLLRVYVMSLSSCFSKAVSGSCCTVTFPCVTWSEVFMIAKHSVVTALQHA